MATGKIKLPDFFNEESIDPVESATGKKQPPIEDKNSQDRKTGMTAKKKAGFYLSTDLLDRFTLKFHELKLAGIAIDNKSTLLELALEYALDDLDKGGDSQVLQGLGGENTGKPS